MSITKKRSLFDTVDNGKVFISFFILAFIMIFIILKKYDDLKNTAIPPHNVAATATGFLVLAFIAMIGVFISFFWIKKEKTNISNIYLFSIIALSLAYVVIFLPFTVPDEAVHFFSSYKLSNYFLLNFNQPDEGTLFVRESDLTFFNSIFRTELSADYYHSVKNSFSLFSQSNNLVEFEHTVTHGTQIGYVASALGIAFSRILHLSPFLTFYIGRVFNVLCYSFVTWWAVKKIPFGKMAVFAISALPMTLHLIASYSYDAITIAAIILFVSQILYICNKKSPVVWHDLLLCAVLSVIIAPSKIVYIPILFIVMFIPKEKFKTKAVTAFSIKAGIIFIGIAVALIIQGASMGRVASSTVCPWTEGELYTLTDILKEPINTIRVFSETLFNKGDFYLSTLVGGSLGWFQIYIPVYCYMPFYFILLYSFMKRDGETAVINYHKKLFMFLIVLVSSFLILLSMFLAWTPNFSPVIEGVQGRYFLPLLMLIYLIVRNKTVSVNSSGDKFLCFFILYWNLYVGIEFFTRSYI